MIGAGPESTSCEKPESAIVEPTNTLAGVASIPSGVAQTFSTPLTSTLPAWAASLQFMRTDAMVVWPAAMSKVVEPEHVSAPSTEVALRVIAKPVPAGSGPMVDEITVLLLTSSVPDFVNPPGPVMAYATVSSVAPGASCRATPSDP